MRTQNTQDPRGAGPAWSPDLRALPASGSAIDTVRIEGALTYRSTSRRKAEALLPALLGKLRRRSEALHRPDLVQQ